MMSSSISSLFIVLIVKECCGGGVATKSCPTPCQVLLSMGFFRQECWSGLPFPSPGALPDPGIEPRSLALQAGSLSTELWGKPESVLDFVKCLFSAYWDLSGGFWSFILLIMVCDINQFSYVESALHTWDIPHLVMVCGPLYVLLDWFAAISLKIFAFI